MILLRVDITSSITLFDFVEPWKIDLLDFLNDNYMYNLSLEEIASFTGRSLSTFKRDLKNKFPLSRKMADEKTSRRSISENTR